MNLPENLSIVSRGPLGVEAKYLPPHWSNLQDLSMPPAATRSDHRIFMILWIWHWSISRDPIVKKNIKHFPDFSDMVFDFLNLFAEIKIKK